MSKEASLSWLASEIKLLARQLGFSACGISGVDLGQQPDYVRQWLAAGFNGQMQWMNNNLDKRCNPQLLEPGTVAVVSVRMDYLPPAASSAKVLADPNAAYISRYALGRDYHKLVRKRLAQLAQQINQLLVNTPALADWSTNFQARAFTDSAPVLEKALAEQAGLGWQGKNCLLITPRAGSWFFLGELYLNLPVPADPPFGSEHCGTCNACQVACPTQAFVGDKLLDARRCISYLTIELKGSIPEELRPLMGNRIYGCDDCQLVCPWNRFAAPTQETDFYPRHELDNSSLLELFAWDENDFLAKTLGSPIRRIGYAQWTRNLAVALGNAPPNPAIQQALSCKLSKIQDQLVAEHLQWAIQRQAAAARQATKLTLHNLAP